MSEVLERVREHEQRLWVPGRGVVDLRIERIQRAVEAYDSRLVLARHELTGDWVIFVKLGPDDLYPVIGLGPELPRSPEEVTQRLARADSRRHTESLLDQINRRNEAIRKAKRDAADEAIGETAEWFEWGYRREGWHPSPRIFVPSDI